MQTFINQAAGVWDSEAEAFISFDHQRLAEVLHDYNPYFSLVWIPPKDRDDTETKPFAILSSVPDKPPHIIRYLSEHEMKNPTEILAWIFEGDLTKHNSDDILSKIEARERAERILQMKKNIDEAESQMDFVEYAVSHKSPHYMRHNGKTFRK